MHNTFKTKRSQAYCHNHISVTTVLVCCYSSDFLSLGTGTHIFPLSPRPTSRRSLTRSPATGTPEPKKKN